MGLEVRGQHRLAADVCYNNLALLFLRDALRLLPSLKFRHPNPKYYSSTPMRTLEETTTPNFERFKASVSLFQRPLAVQRGEEESDKYFIFFVNDISSFYIIRRSSLHLNQTWITISPLGLSRNRWNALSHVWHRNQSYVQQCNAMSGYISYQIPFWYKQQCPINKRERREESIVSFMIKRS